MVTAERYGQIRPWEKIVVIRDDDPDKAKIRVKKEPDGCMFAFRKGSSRYGKRYSATEFCQIFTIKEVDKEAQWHKRIKRAVNAMQNSGLWPEILETYRNLDKMSLEDRDSIRRIYDSVPYGEDSRSEKVKEALKDFIAKYPFIITSDGYIDTDYIWELSEATLKPMYFGKYRNADEKAAIASAIEDRRPYSTRARASYDVSFEYDPGKQKAFYREEYRNCGNGHYYVALDGNLALFCEND